MLELRDKTFDPRFFKGVIEILDSIYIAQKLSERDPEYYVEYGGRNAEGYIHKIILRNRETNTGFTVVLYENQSLKYKGYFRFRFKDIEFDSRKNTAFLKKAGFKKWDKKKDGISWAYAIYLDNLEDQVLTLATHYSKYLL